MSQMTLVFTLTVCKCSQWNTNLALTQTQWALCDSFLMWCVSQASGPCHYSPSRGVEEKNSSFYLHNGCLMVISWTNAALVYWCVFEIVILLFVGIKDVRDWNNSHMFECKLYPDGFHFRRVSGWLTGLSDMRSIKSAWHDPRLSFSPCPQSQIYSSCFGAECPVIDWVTEYEISHFTCYLNVSDFCLIVVRRMCRLKLLNCLCMCPTSCLLSALLLPEHLEGGRLRGLWKRPRVALSPTVSRQCVCHVPHLHRHILQQVIDTNVLMPFLCWFNICPVAITYREVMSQIVKVQRNRKCQRNHSRSLHTEERICCVML